MALSHVAERLNREADKPERDDAPAMAERPRIPLHIGAAHDPAEAAADRVADEVLRKIADDEADAGAGGHPAAAPELAGIARIGAEGGAAPDAVADAIARAQASGRPLDAPVRRRLEPAFGRSLSGVRVHDDARAAQVAATLSADAFTVGKDIFFGAGQYRPGGPDGDHVLAHELAHTFQAGPARRSVIHRKLAGTAEAMQSMGGDRTSGKVRKFFGKPTNWDKILDGLGRYEEMEAQVVARPARLGQLRSQMMKTLRGVSSSVVSWRADNKPQETERKTAASRRGNVKHADVTESDTRYKTDRRQAIALVEPRVNNEMKLLADDQPGAWQRSLGLSPDKVASAGGTDSGEKNTVQELHYDTEAGAMSGFFKKDIGFNPSPEFHEMKTGIAQHDPNYGARTVAMYRLDQLLKAGVTARAEFAVHKDGAGKSVLGTVLESAKGKSGLKTEFAMDSEHAKRIGPGAVAMDDPVLLRGLNKLQILDAIAGQLDRHIGNYYINTDAKGSVTGITGIDLDMAFGSEMTSPDHQSSSAAHNYRGLPKAIDAEMGAAILTINDTDIRDALAGLLSTAEIDATVQRFLAVQHAVQEASDAGTLRDDWGARGNSEHVSAANMPHVGNRTSYADDIAGQSLSQLKRQVTQALDEVYSGDLKGHRVARRLLPDFHDLPPQLQRPYDIACRRADTAKIIPGIAEFIFDHHVPGDMIASFIDAAITELLDQDRFNKAMVEAQELADDSYRATFESQIVAPAIKALPGVWARMSSAQRRQNRRAGVRLGNGR